MTIGKQPVFMRFVLTLILVWVVAPSYAGSFDDCGTVAGAAQLWAKPTTRYVLIGEFHGMAETPAAFGDIVCAAAHAGKAVVVGLELPQREQPFYDAYLASDGTEADRAKLFGATMWTSGMKDGRTSLAMLALLDKLRKWKRAGANIALVAFQPNGMSSGVPSAPSEYEARMANIILAAAAKNTGRLVVALMGNWHASKSRELFPGASLPYDPMAMHLLAEAIVNILAVPLKSGSAWNCMPRGADKDARSVVCGPHPFAMQATLGNVTPSAPGVTMFDKTYNGYDGILALERATASPPAVP